MNSNAKIDALELMLTDLRTRNEPIRHKAAFRGCQPEFQALVSRLIEQLENELLDEKHRYREVPFSCLLRSKQITPAGPGPPGVFPKNPYRWLVDKGPASARK